MKEDMNENRPSESTNGPDHILAGALEALLEGQLQGGVSSPHAGAGLGACPEPGEWIRLAGGEARPAQVDALLAHAGNCGECASRLRRSLHLFSEQVSPEEAEAAGNLASASEDWHHSLAARLARTPHKNAAANSARIYLWAGAGLAAALLLTATLTLGWREAHTPERLLAEAYTRSRVFDLRMPGAGFAEVTPQVHLRGGGTSGRESSRLLEARTRIQRKLESSPDNPHWLQLEARADLMEEKFDAAIDILDRLLAAGPVTSSLLVDDAAAYFERGAATGSENDRATALDNLRRADELAPGDPVVLFNEAVAMEDRGQMMNAVETWNRYLRFERDSKWQTEGRRRLELLEKKLNQLRTHKSRLEQRLATPQTMRTLAADPAALAAIDEELSSALLPRLLLPAFPLPVDRSRGSPCDEACTAARTLLDALASSLERNHQDPWLTQFLPSDLTHPTQEFSEAAQALGKAIAADVNGEFLPARASALKAQQLFHGLANAAGEDRAQVEFSYARQRLSDIAGCYTAAHPLLSRDPQFAWIQIHALTQDSLCDPAPGTAREENPAFVRAMKLAHDRRYILLELRARNMLGAAAVDSADVEASWRTYLPTVRMFYDGDYPALRLYTTLSGLEEIEEATPRVQHTLLLQREVLGVLALTGARELILSERFKLATVAMRAGSIAEAKEQMRLAQSELAATGGGESVKGDLAEAEMAMANLYLERRDLTAAATMLEQAEAHMAGEHNTYHAREFAVARGQLELALGHSEAAEALLRKAIVEEERLSAKGGAENITNAQQDRELYAVLAGVWLAQSRSGEDALALWERYRIRILGLPVAACAGGNLSCLKPSLMNALARLGPDRVLGQVVLLDRVLLYRASSQGVVWTSAPVGRAEILAAAAPLERAASSPSTSQASVSQAARRVGDLLLGALTEQSSSPDLLILEPDPLLGNLPWPAVETATGPIGLRFDLQEAPSLLLDSRSAASTVDGSPLVVGASLGSGESVALPEAMNEARAVARFGRRPNLLLAVQATEPRVTAGLRSATAIHFAGHAVWQDGATRLLLAPSGLTGDHPYLDSNILRKNPPRGARLAVFSACSSGKREEGWNHGIGDIVDTLASVGVPEVVATRWQIDSSSAVPMMDAFYSGLAKGLSVPAALTAARQSMVQDLRYRHPYYWAAYYAAGTGKADLRTLFAAAR